MDKCPFCGTSYKEIMQTGFVGCENCYYTIDGLKNAVASLYDGKKYKGKKAGKGNGSF